ncbi:UPF0701 protein HI_0467 [Haloferula helveola]
MTGFGRGSASTDRCTATVEIAGVNRKQAEVVVQGLRDQVELENRIRKAVLARISRGRLQVSVVIERTDGDGSSVQADLALASQLDDVFKSLSQHLGRTVAPEPADFLRVPGLIRFDGQDIDPEASWEAVDPALEEALAQLMSMRKAEGADLVADLQQRLEQLESHRNAIGEIAPTRPAHFREVLLKRLSDAELDLDLDDERVLREIGLFADRCDITEELTRLDAHFGRFREYLSGGEPAGRPLDFLCQEIHREFNTIGSKASDAAIAQLVVAAKTELEKIREQVQNIE